MKKFFTNAYKISGFGQALSLLCVSLAASLELKVFVCPMLMLFMFLGCTDSLIKAFCQY